MSELIEHYGFQRAGTILTEETKSKVFHFEIPPKEKAVDRDFDESFLACSYCELSLKVEITQN